MVVRLDRPSGRKRPRRPGMPETMRLIAASERSQGIGDFLDWLDDQGVVLASWENGELYPTQEATESLLARHFGIDLARVNRERGRLLAWLRTRGDL